MVFFVERPVRSREIAGSGRFCQQQRIASQGPRMLLASGHDV